MRHDSLTAPCGELHPAQAARDTARHSTARSSASSTSSCRSCSSYCCATRPRPRGCDQAREPRAGLLPVPARRPRRSQFACSSSARCTTARRAGAGLMGRRALHAYRRVPRADEARRAPAALERAEGPDEPRRAPPGGSRFIGLHAAEFAVIHTVSPGMTGLSQLAFAREASVLDPEDRVGHYVRQILPAESSNRSALRLAALVRNGPANPGLDCPCRPTQARGRCPSADGEHEPPRTQSESPSSRARSDGGVTVSSTFDFPTPWRAPKEARRTERCGQPEGGQGSRPGRRARHAPGAVHDDPPQAADASRRAVDP